MAIALWILAAHWVALALIGVMCRYSPFGYQDRDGFHHGEPALVQTMEGDGPNSQWLAQPMLKSFARYQTIGTAG